MLFSREPQEVLCFPKTSFSFYLCYALDFFSRGLWFVKYCGLGRTGLNTSFCGENQSFLCFIMPRTRLFMTSSVFGSFASLSIHAPLPGSFTRGCTRVRTDPHRNLPVFAPAVNVHHHCGHPRYVRHLQRCIICASSTMQKCRINPPVVSSIKWLSRGLQIVPVGWYYLTPPTIFDLPAWSLCTEV